MKGIWENSEVRELFLEVESCKNKNKSLREAFAMHAQKYNRKPNSVRNYYYMEVDELEKDKSRLESIGIDLSMHKKTAITYFSENEENKLMDDITSLVNKGLSVRKACYTLSKGDVALMLRFQNKYRNFLFKKNNQKFSNAKLTEIKEKPSNVITFKKTQKALTDSEVQSLFMGLVRLVKKNAIIEKEENYKKELTSANDLLRKTLIELSTKQREYDKLKEDYIKIKTENVKLNEKIFYKKCDKAAALREKISNKEKAFEI